MTAGPDSLRARELDVAREVAHAFLTASTPVEVYRLALARVTPLVRARFSSVFLRDSDDPTLLRLACAHNWPQSSARYLGQLRLRVGRGPTGRAVSDRQPIEVTDVFADPTLHEWREPARELGFVSLISLPLLTDDTAAGALTFYFTETHEFDDDERHLLMLVADQVALAGGRIESLYAERRELGNLRVENERLRKQVGEGESAQRMKDEFLSNISHELRTPLTSILGYTDLLTTGLAGSLDETQSNAVQRIGTSANVLLRLITDLLELSQLKLGRSSVTISRDDAVNIARHALDTAASAQPGVTVTLDTVEDHIPILTDSEKVGKILENLIDNACKFTAQGSVTLSVRRATYEAGPAIEWAVTDTGIGIPADKLDTVFDEFRQVDGSSTRLYGGTGLGLALCRALTRLLNGRLTVRSEVGRGSEFRLLLPVSNASA